MPEPRPSLRTAALLAAGAGAATAVRRRTASSALDTADLSGRTAVVTGAGSGIGRSLALLLGNRGALVHAADIAESSAVAVAEQIRAAGGRAKAHTVDVADPDAVVRLADACFAEGPVDLLFNNAGIGHAGAVVDTTLEDWRRLLDVNLMGVVHGIAAFLPRLLEQGRPAHVMNTASMAGLVPAPGLAAYSATKAAVVGLTDALDMELRGTAVSVSALCPGIISTEIVRTSTMRGDWVERQAQTAEFYATKGTSPDVVARQALTAIARGERVVPSPRYQVVPHWTLKRVWPPAARAVSLALVRYASKAR